MNIVHALNQYLCPTTPNSSTEGNPVTILTRWYTEYIMLIKISRMSSTSFAKVVVNIALIRDALK